MSTPSIARGALLAMLTTLLLSGCSDDPESNSMMTTPTADMSTSQDMTPPALDMTPGLDMTVVTPPDMTTQADMGMDEPDLFGEPDLEGLSQEQRAIAEVPRTEAWALPGLKKPAHVVFTEHGRPHVYAEDREDLGYVLGFIVARDRYFVMDLQRRLAQGTISSLLGDAALANDVEARMIGMNHVTQLVLDNLSPERAAYLDAYVRGINAYIDRVRSKELPAPSELSTFGTILGIRKVADAMKPFTRRDIAAMVAVIMYETNFDSGDIGRTAQKQRLDALMDKGTDTGLLRIAGAREDIFKGGLAPLFDVHSASGWEIEEGSPSTSLRPLPGKKRGGEARGQLRALPADMLSRAEERHERLQQRFGRTEIDNFGSNTWAVQGTKTADGAGLVAGDGHLPLSVPALMYQIGLDTTTFGQQALRQTGLLITSLPVLAVGTNGDVAWSQVNPFADITDWYAERIELDAQGKPVSAYFQDQPRPLTQVDESYEIAEVRALMSEERTEVWARWVTFDGRWIFDIEGTPLESPGDAGDGDYVVNLGGRYVVPGDVNQDGVISAISFDYTALDTTRYVDTLDELTFAKDIREYQELTKGFIGNLLYSAVTDTSGDILFTSYQAVPCRGYLARDAQGEWEDAAHPRYLLDGNTYGGFSIPSFADGKVDESQGVQDPYKCVVPFDETPQAINPPQGFVLNANNQPAPILNDASLSDDPWYIGGPWRDVRADTIQQGLQQATQDGQATIEDMATIQADTRSRTGEMFATHFADAILSARALSMTDGPITPDGARLIALYTADSARFDDIEQRLRTWSMRTYPASSGVETFYNTPTEQDRADAVITMIFNAWLPRMMQATFDDEALYYSASGSVTQLRVLKRMLDGRGDNSTALASYYDLTNESVFFDKLGTDELERSDEMILTSLTQALAFLESDPVAPAEGGFGTADMSQWLWGMRHQVRFESLLADFLGGTDFGSFLDTFSITTETLPLAENLPQDDPRADLKWFPRPGDNFAVDAANPGFSGTNFTHGSGPVMRMVISLKGDEVKGQNIIPGGQSGLNDSPYFADQARLWLGNETVPLRFYPEDVAAGAQGRAYFVPLPDTE